jgi:HlyD family secretion protein
MRFELTRRRVLVGAGVLAAVALLGLAMRPTSAEVEMGVARLGPLEVWIEEDGRTRAIDRYVIAAPVAGRLQRITLLEGATIESGAVVARIEPLPLDASTQGQLQAQLNAARARAGAADAAVTQAAAAAEQATRELERRRVLMDEGVGTEEQLEQYALALRVRQQELEAAQASARAAAADVEAMRSALLGAPGAAPGTAVAVRSPGSGAVLRVHERSERVVQTGEPLLEVGDPGGLEVIVDVLTPDAVRVHPGMPARLTGWGGDTLRATVRGVEPSAFTRVSALGVEEQRVNVVLDLEHRPPTLGDGYRVDARIVVWAADEALTVPAAAVFRGAGGGWQAFVVEDGRARLRDVRVGERGEGRTQIVSGLEAGETVVLFPPDDLEDGARVRGVEG